MNIIDRISLHRIITTVMNFILAIIKLLVNKSNDGSAAPRRIFPRFRKDK